MTFLPIVERELRVSARRHSTYWLRLLVAFCAIVVGVFLFIAHLEQRPQVVSHEIFQGLSILALICGLVSGRLWTADSLSQEKRDGTLGLLFLTDLKGYDVVLGKLAANSVSAFYGLLSIFPVLAVPVLIGGVSNAEFWRMILVLVVTFLYSLTIGVFSSVLSRSLRQATGLNFALSLLVMVVPPALGGLIAYKTPSNYIVSWLLFPCPVTAFYLAPDTYFRWRPFWFWGSVGTMHALTWLLVAWASWLIPKTWQDRATPAGKIAWRDRWQKLVYGDSAQRRTLRRRLLSLNAFCWLASRARFKPIGVWLFLVFVAGWWAYMRKALRLEWADEYLCLMTAVMLNSVFKLWVGIESGWRLAEDQKIGALELLLSTPLRVRDIIGGQLLALRRQFLKPLILVTVSEILFILAVTRSSYQEQSRPLAFGLTSLLLLLLDSTALIGVAMNTGLTARSPNHASVSTISKIMILPWVIYAAIAIFTGLWSAMSGSSAPTWRFFLYLWFVLGLIADVGFGLPAWVQLATRFRQLALKRFTARPA